MTDVPDLGKLGPQIQVEPPGPKSWELARRLSACETPNASQVGAGDRPVFWDQARGANIVDVDGNVFVDLTAGFCVAIAGHSNPRIVEAIAGQAARMMHSQGGANPNPVRVELAERLAQVAPKGLTMSHICNTGAEAVEMALKTARNYTKRPNVIAFHGGFHGKTMGALAVTSQNFYREPFLAGLPGAIHIPYAYCYRCAFGKEYPGCDVHCAKYLEYVLEMPDSGVAGLAAVILEPVQGHGGWITPPARFLPEVARICKKHGILLIADEIITGFGRTGRLFATEHSDVVPDILVVAKGLASGFPISAMITRPEIGRAWKPMQHTSTFMGNPIGCAAALASIAEILEKGLVERSAQLGAYFKAELEKMRDLHPLVGDVRGLGMMVGMEFVKDRETKEPASELGHEVVLGALARGVMATNYGGTYHNVLKMSPPLVITKEQLDVSLQILDDTLSAVEARL